MDQRVYMFTFIAFIVGMSELIVSGILDLIAAGLNVRISTAGLLITVFAVFYGIRRRFCSFCVGLSNGKR